MSAADKMAVALARILGWNDDCRLRSADVIRDAKQALAAYEAEKAQPAPGIPRSSLYYIDATISTTLEFDSEPAPEPADERTTFENWAADQAAITSEPDCWARHRFGGDYVYQKVEMAWRAWRDGRAAGRADAQPAPEQIGGVVVLRRKRDGGVSRLSRIMDRQQDLEACAERWRASFTADLWSIEVTRVYAAARAEKGGTQPKSPDVGLEEALGFTG